MDDYGMDNQSKQGKEYEPEERCDATDHDESLINTYTDCGLPAVWGLVNEESGATIWHCAKHQGEYRDAANAIADSYR